MDDYMDTKDILNSLLQEIEKGDENVDDDSQLKLHMLVALGQISDSLRELVDVMKPHTTIDLPHIALAGLE